MTTRRDISAVVIGAGLGGLAAAVDLRRRGIRGVTLLEKADRVGGVWRDNTYPGAACDVPSSLYSYSLAPNPEWPRRYGARPDILRYIEDVVDREGLSGLVRTGTEVTDAAWDDASGRWQVRTRRSEAPPRRRSTQPSGTTTSTSSASGSRWWAPARARSSSSRTCNGEPRT